MRLSGFGREPLLILCERRVSDGCPRMSGNVIRGDDIQIRRPWFTPKLRGVHDVAANQKGGCVQLRNCTRGVVVGKQVHVGHNSIAPGRPAGLSYTGYEILSWREHMDRRKHRGYMNPLLQNRFTLPNSQIPVLTCGVVTPGVTAWGWVYQFEHVMRSRSSDNPHSAL